MTHPTDIDVLIVGAGPTGLTMACLLAQYGVSFRIIDVKETITDRSKALGVQARTLELFEQLDLAEKAISKGHPTTGLDLVVNGKLRASLDLAVFGKTHTKYPYVLILEQCKTEAMLLEKLQSLDGDVLWQQELLELHQKPDCIQALIRHGSGTETLRAQYVFGADGAKSIVRHQMGVSFEGGTYENRFMLADMAMDWEYSKEHITLCLSKEGFAGFFPMYGTNRFRAIGILPDSVPANADTQFADIAPEIQKQADVSLKLSDPKWISTYKIHHRYASAFRVGRCFIGGDAAHIHSPAGAQGMNTGIQDAFNLAWKFSQVLSGRAHDSLLDTYHEERFPFAQRLIRTTDRGFSFATNMNFFVKNARLYLLPLALKALTRFSNFGEFVFKTVSQIGINYRGASLNFQKKVIRGSCHAGDRFSVEKFGKHGFLEKLDPCHDGSFHAFLIGAPDAQEEVTVVLQQFFDDQIKIHTLAGHSDVANVLLDLGIEKDGILIVRPDQYIMYIAQEIDLGELQKYLKRYFIRQEVPQPQAKFDEKHLHL